MNREFLEGLGLEKETIDKVMAEHGKTLNDTKNQLETVTTERDDLRGQLSERDEQLEELKKVDAEGLQAKIDELQTENETTKQEYQAKLEKQAFDFSLEKALTGAKVRNSKAVKALLDLDSIKLDGEKLLGLDDQLSTIKESDGYLFEDEKQTNDIKPNFTTGQHQTEGSKDNDPFMAKLAKYN